jgi:ppGpp synthetase/RelA/SpoT-type nucleotidyltranferase
MDPTHPQPPDPLVRMTDLCGGRVIAQTAEQVHAICEFIERTFDIDKPNSEDVSQRLKPTEFGYRSVHYIVQVDPTKLKGAGVELRVPTGILGAVRPESPEPAGLKAEIQVRTLLEHAYADIAHDLIYKAEVKVPDRIRRQYAALAAVLEGADREFGRLLASLEEFKSNFGAWHRPNEVYDEINRLRIDCPQRAQALPNQPASRRATGARARAHGTPLGQPVREGLSRRYEPSRGCLSAYAGRRGNALCPRRMLCASR